jgi:hypothetical protein
VVVCLLGREAEVVVEWSTVAAAAAGMADGVFRLPSVGRKWREERPPIDGDGESNTTSRLPPRCARFWQLRFFWLPFFFSSLFALRWWWEEKCECEALARGANNSEELA